MHPQNFYYYPLSVYPRLDPWKKVILASQNMLTSIFPNFEDLSIKWEGGKKFGILRKEKNNSKDIKQTLLKVVILFLCMFGRTI